MSANITAANPGQFPSDVRTGDGHSGLTRFAWGVLGWNVLVIVWGAYVRASKSGDGCGSHWPLCNGEVVPSGTSTISTFVEFAHRLTSGLALIGVIVMLVWGFRAFAKGHVVRKAVAFSLFFILVEALIGALLVKLSLVAENKSVARAIYLSVHLVNTFLLLGALSLSVWWASGRPSITFSGQGFKSFLIVIGLAATIAVGVTGAIAALGDTLFPAQSLSHGFEQELSGLSHFTVRLRWLHPVVAIGASLVVAAVAWRAKSLGSSTSRLLGWLVVGTVVLQLFLGALNVWLLAPIWMQLVHLLFADALWVLMVLLSASLLSRTKSVYQGAIA